MIAFGCSITDPEMYRKAAERGLRRVAEPDSQLIANAASGSIARSYNVIMDSVAEREDLEALVLVHQDAELASDDLCLKLRGVFAHPDVGVAGCVGAVDVRSIAWWEGSTTWAAFAHRYPEFGGGEITAFTWRADGHPGYARTGEVETLDGFVLALSPWAVRNIRFDETLSRIHGYDLDFCLQVREAGRKVVTVDVKAVHHHSLELVRDPDSWIAAHIKVAEKWEGRMPGIGRPNWSVEDENWRRRARLAEAEAGAAGLERISMQMQAEALERRLRGELDVVLNSTSWRVTRPLRALSATFKARKDPTARRRRR
ncbi:MAG: hypothetical protein JO153_11745 [Solirubrobacterales bacterium]|nr:hypothetical protein [Solirubrobacterales bacterium]